MIVCVYPSLSLSLYIYTRVKVVANYIRAGPCAAADATVRPKERWPCLCKLRPEPEDAASLGASARSAEGRSSATEKSAICLSGQMALKTVTVWLHGSARCCDADVTLTRATVANHLTGRQVHRTRWKQEKRPGCCATAASTSVMSTGQYGKHTCLSSLVLSGVPWPKQVASTYALLQSAPTASGWQQAT